MKDLKLKFENIKIDPLAIAEYGDLVIENGDIKFTDSIIQAITIRLRWFFNEFKYNPDFGLPYYEDVFVKNPNMGLIRQEIVGEILKVEEVEEVQDIDLSLVDGRKLLVKFVVKIKERTERGEAVVLG